MKTSELMDLIQRRRSIFPKFYTGESVPKEIIEEMLEAANWAPTHKFTEPWRFVVFEGEGIQAFANFQAEQYKLASSVEKFVPDKFEKLRKKPMKSSHIIAVGMKRDKDLSLPEVEEICAVACAVQNMLLVGADRGVGCYWSTGGVTYDKESKEFFGLGEEDMLLGFIYIGVAESVLKKGRRNPIQEKVSWVTTNK
jgi:nitroreductase